jgi:hypothetical protein
MVANAGHTTCTGSGDRKARGQPRQKIGRCCLKIKLKIRSSGSLLSGKDCKDCGVRPVQDQRLLHTMSTNIKLGILVCVCLPSYVGSLNKRIPLQAGPDIKTRHYPQNNKTVKRLWVLFMW